MWSVTYLYENGFMVIIGPFELALIPVKVFFVILNIWVGFWAITEALQ